MPELESLPFAEVLPSVSEGTTNSVDFCRTGFLTLDTVDILGRVLPVVGGLCIAEC